MHAEEIAQIVIEALDQEEKNFIMLNFANCDLVGHTGDLEATITAVETVDEQIGRLREKVEASKYDMV
ncbi:phosphoglyceromutase, partial [Candidatus Haloredivivus sp. G17]